jgi:hypothetical protein
MISERAFRYFELPGARRVEFRFSENSWDFAATVLSGFRGRPKVLPGSARATRPNLQRDMTLRAQVLKTGLKAASFPFHWAGRVLGRGVALVAIIEKNS